MEDLEAEFDEAMVEIWGLESKVTIAIRDECLTKTSPIFRDLLQNISSGFEDHLLSPRNGEA